MRSVVSSHGIVADMKLLRKPGANVCCFVRYRDSRSGKAAIEGLTGYVFDGKILSCRFADKSSSNGRRSEMSGPQAAQPSAQNWQYYQTAYEPVSVFVGGFPNSCNDVEITNFFGRCGFGESQIKIYRKSGSNTCVFLSCAGDYQAKEAIQRFGGVDFSGRVLSCRLAGDKKPEAQGSPNQGPSGQSYYGRGRTDISIQNLSAAVTQAVLESCLSRFGQIANIKGSGSSNAWVSFRNAESATAAVETMNGQPLFPGDPPLLVQYSSRIT